MNQLKREIDSEIEEGYTNQVYLSNEDTILKKYRRYSIGGIGHSVRELLFFQNIVCLEDRINMEYLVRNKVEDEVKYPHILDQEDNWLEFEKIDSKSVFELLEDEKSDAEDLGKKVGETMQRLHSQGIYMTDWALDDVFLVDGEILILDFEFAAIGKNKLREIFDEISVFSQLGNFDADTIKKFVSGLREFKNMGKIVVLTGFFVSFLFNLIYFWDDGKPVKVLKNLISTIIG